MTSIEQHINILIAEDNDISRELMAGILKTHGYNTISALDGTEAIQAVGEHAIDLALVDLNMEPKGGFEFVRHLIVHGIKIPVVIITADDSSDILMRAQELGVTRVMQKPVEPERLLKTAEQVLKRNGHNLNVIASQAIELTYSHEQLMQRAIDMADRNAQSRKGGPFGAVIASTDGKVLGEGANGITSRVDPTAHAEIMAIRQASEKLGRADLSDCLLYCSSEPTKMGKALIESVGITQVYFGLSHADIKDICSRENPTPDTRYEQIGQKDALRMFSRWRKMGEPVTD